MSNPTWKYIGYADCSNGQPKFRPAIEECRDFHSYKGADDCSLLLIQNGSTVEGIIMWRKNVDRDVEGAEACTICMMTIHSTNHQLPKVGFTLKSGALSPRCFSLMFNIVDVFRSNVGSARTSSTPIAWYVHVFHAAAWFIELHHYYPFKPPPIAVQMVRIEQSDKLPSMSFEFWVKPGHGPVWLRLLSVFSLLTCCLMNVIVNNKWLW